MSALTRPDPALKVRPVTPKTEQRLRQALEERDRALAALARERTLVNALRLARERQGEPTPPVYPAEAGLGDPPLRYQVVDAANERVKTLVAPLHRLVKRLVERS